MQAGADPFAQPRERRIADEREEVDPGQPGEELHAELGDGAEGLGQLEVETAGGGAEPAEDVARALELRPPRQLRVHYRRPSRRRPVRPGEVVAKETLARRLVAHGVDADAREPCGPGALRERRLQDQRHRTPVGRLREPAEPAVGGEDLEEQVELGSVDRRLNEARAVPAVASQVASIDLGLEPPALVRPDPLSDEAQHAPVRPRALVQRAQRPAGPDRHVAHLQAVEGDVGVAPRAQERPHAREVGNRIRHVAPRPPAAAAASATLRSARAHSRTKRSGTLVNGGSVMSLPASSWVTGRPPLRRGASSALRPPRQPPSAETSSVVKTGDSCSMWP